MSSGKTVDFSEALKVLKSGKPMQRCAWTNIKCVWGCICEGEAWEDKEGIVHPRASYFYQEMENGTVSPWLPTNDDLLSNDWF